ncbi:MULTISPECIES: DUF4199 domain-containing protein [Mesoflavibacter]|uniref:DUF4199 domain-containing protein n=1 Tax=Mesoflavibacter profundi TaxID=2708110 RepID=A0ABT4RZL5_9FLAO|nr:MULTISPECIES: DUF4199 domain-containing protein [Mesoflavibacter]MDA0177006.1 DUF4199 domain-containing protein [Mesoflavibacter profundi]QIJ87921.1 hypothetical protein C7H62_0111 [Mesoflavibacter sp. HG96]QIJ90649.1 hypothetical protein C7H56_0111 [Mesoflavibacter sp. HG37]
MEKSIKSIATNNGLYLGLLLTLVYVIAYAVNLELLTKWWIGIGLLIAIVIFGIVSISKTKSALGGFISLKEGFTAYFITILLGLVVASIVSIVLFNFIDPDAAITLKEKTIEATAETMRNWNAPEESIIQTVEQMREQPNQFSIGSVLQSLVIQLVIYSIIGLIAALIMKKSDDNA